MGCFAAICVIWTVKYFFLDKPAVSDFNGFTQWTGIRLPADGRVTEFADDDSWIPHPGGVFWVKIVTNKGAINSTIATLPKTMPGWMKASHQGDKWQVTSNDRRSIGRINGTYNITGSPVPEWWDPSSMHDITASAGSDGLKRYWVFCGRDDSGEYVIFICDFSG